MFDESIQTGTALPTGKGASMQAFVIMGIWIFNHGPWPPPTFQLPPLPIIMP